VRAIMWAVCLGCFLAGFLLPAIASGIRHEVVTATAVKMLVGFGVGSFVTWELCRET